MLDDGTLSRLRAALEEQRENLRKEIQEQGADPDSDELEIDVERGFSDSAHSTAERSRVLSVVRALRSNLRDVERALAKMELGTYGRCESCGRPISAERLEAIPWALLCIDCKRKGVTR
ncbi:MAG TPA: TraR/DksA C4-type zinc finger protein [Actinomycetota bacterium]|nr:TraR/DksA C4-type zinc finger protein [Actinomycetota bacterium]